MENKVRVKKKYKRIAAIVAGIFAVVIAGPAVRSFADTASTTHFTVQDGFVGMFGGYASSTDFQVVNGGSGILNNNATSTDFNSNTGPVNFSDFAPMSEMWEWYGDANDETPTSSLAAVNTAPANVANAQVIKLRLDIKETSGVTGSDDLKFQLQFAQSSDFTASPGFVAEAGNCNATSSWCYATSTGGNDNQIISTKIFSTSDACSAGVGKGCGTHNTSGVSTSTLTQSAGATTEYEFTLMASGALAGNTYFFRPVNTTDGSAVLLGATSSYPSLVTQGATITFAIGGLPQSTSTNGVVTNVGTTATGIPFGTLALGTSTIGAQRLWVTTNAANGYEVYTEEDQPLADSRGDQVPGISGTNGSPVAWSSGCTATSTGCYGYHAGSPVLSGGSVRFAAADSYAALTPTIAEVGYGGVPTNSSTMDMIYRIQIAGTQVTGAYQNNLTYVVAPSF
ncbi:MAG: hypothetical protein WCF77_05010 [Minisyncoccia bacterium]|jgi:hypothetical protein